MNKNLKKDIIGYLTIFGNLWLTVMLIDWDRFFKYQDAQIYEEYTISRVIKLGLTFLAFYFVTVLRKAKITSRDHTLLSIVFGIFLAAEIAFFNHRPMIGIISFGAAQILLIVRNLTGIKKYLSERKRTSDIIKLLAAIIPIIFINCFIIRFLFCTFRSSDRYIVIVVYSGLLCLSVFAGVATTLTGYFSKNNAILILVGVLLFYVGDITVGMNILLHATDQHIEYIISSSLTWFFYLPSMVFLALSGISWDNTLKESIIR